VSNRWDLCQAKPGKNGKTYWNKVATMFEGKEGKFNIEFDALPVPVAEQSQDGAISIRTRAVAFPAKERDAGQQSNQQSGGWAGGSDDLDDEIAF
jgi:hypothetical protein